MNDIHRVYKDQTDPNNIDLVKFGEYMNKQKNLPNDHMFIKKLKKLEGMRTISRK